MVLKDIILRGEVLVVKRLHLGQTSDICVTLIRPIPLPFCASVSLSVSKGNNSLQI